VAIAAVISFFISSIIIKATEGKGGKSLKEAQSQKDAMKAEAKGLAVTNAEVAADAVKKIIFACDAGMGSSAMGATKFRNRIKDARPEITVKNSSVDNIPADCDIAVVQATLQDRARAAAPQAKLVIINNFLADPALDTLYAQLVDGDTKAEETLEDTEDKKKKTE
jgi:PTS system mannitol-specific IIC component